jgi:hypothetical protein
MVSLLNNTALINHHQAVMSGKGRKSMRYSYYCFAVYAFEKALLDGCFNF